MKQREVVFSPEAESDLTNLLDFIAARSIDRTALTYILRIERFLPAPTLRWGGAGDREFKSEGICTTAFVVANPSRLAKKRASQCEGHIFSLLDAGIF
jgi:hypothetical protein